MSATTVVVSSAYTIANSDFFISGSSITAFAVTLPTGATHAGQLFIIKDTGGNAATANITVAGTIDGVSGKTISIAYGFLAVYTIDGTNYWSWDYGSGTTPYQFTWTGITANQTLVAQNGYYVTSGTLSELFLPNSNCPAGSIIEVALTTGGTSFTITQGSGQTIVFGNISTTVGAGGSLASSSTGDTVRLLCTTAASGSAGTFQVLSAVGNFVVT